MVGAEIDELRIGFDGIVPFFSNEKFCCFGSELLHELDRKSVV